MNFLVIDRDELTIEMCRVLKMKEPSWDFTNIQDIENPIEVYKTKEFDFVFVDLFFEENRVVFDEILKINKEQKTITLSKKLEASEFNGCEFCVGNYKRRRLLKPFSIKELYHTIINFENIRCRYYKSFESIEIILDEILEQFLYYVYNKDSKSILLKDSERVSLEFNELLEIIKLLDNNNIKYKVIDNKEIRIYEE